jgi:AraC-like DNA-binding protein
MKIKLLICYGVVMSFFMNLAYSQDKIQTIRDSIQKNIFSAPKKAKILSHQLLVIAKNAKIAKEEARAYCLLAHLSGALSQKDSAFYYYDKAISKAIENNDDTSLMYYKLNKSDYLFSEYDFDGALILYDQCLDLAKKNNDDNTYNLFLIKKANVNYEIGNYKEALETFKNNLNNNNFNKPTKLTVLLGLSKTYLKLNEPDSAFIYTKKGINEAKSNHLSEFEMHFFNQQGLIFIYKNNYTQAKESFEKALFLSKQSGIIEMTRLILINTSKLYLLQKENEKSIAILKQIIENKENLTISNENIAEIDYLLAENYKEINKLSLSNFHFQKFIQEDKKLGQKKIETIDHLHKIDVSEIKDQKEALINEKRILIILLLVFCMLAFLFYRNKKKKDRENQIKFESLIQKINNYENEFANEKLETSKANIASINEPVGIEEEDSGIISDTSINETISLSKEDKLDNDISNNSFVIKDETVNEILEKLIKLEQKKYFLNQECTLHNVAKELKTNTAYLSKIVNNELGKSFSTYINELRINYIIIELKENAKLRSYSLNAIAIEIGYKRPDAFAKYFKEATGISPAVYIKKINKMIES